MNEVYEIRGQKGFFGRLRDMSALSWIVWANVIIFIIELIVLSSNKNGINYFAINAVNIFSFKYPWTLILHMFSHANFLHLLVNMLALLSFGKIAERIIGRKRFFWFYLAAGMFAGLLSVSLAKLYGYGFWANVFGSPDIYMLGASGAIFGVAGLFVVLLPRLRFGILFIPFFSLPGVIMIPAFLVILWLVSVFAGLPVGNVAHFGGFLAGVLYGFYLKIKYPKKVGILQRHFR